MLDSLARDGAVVLANRYELSGVLGVGGMGTVYRARDRELEELVALKVLRRELVSQPGMVERFRREVKLARRVTHRNVARVFDIGEHDGEKFITMELVDGESLGALLAREGRLSVGEVVATLSSIVAGLGAAHAAGVVHRDLKPDNVLVASDGRIVITDFGIARALAYAGQGAGRTLGFVVGTPDYMAPEQIENAAVIDGRTDLYALGVMLFEMLTGEPPFKGDSPLAIVTARLVSPPPDPRRLEANIPDALARLVLRLLARVPLERPADAAEVASVLGGLTLPAPPARRPSVRPGAARGPRRLAVVPLATDNPDLAWLGYGLAELIADGLDGRTGVDVRARGARLLDAVHRPLDALGEDLGTPLVVGGTLAEDESGAIRGELRLINARDGFVLWSRDFNGRAKSDALGLAAGAADEIGSALLIGARPHITTTADDRAVAACLRARYEAARGGQDGADRAIALYERAIARAPEDPWIKASYALALARRLAETELPGDAEEAVAMAEAAVARAPELADAHLALAAIHLDRGRALDAARALVVARSRAPSNPGGERLFGRLLVDIGDTEAALAALRSASSREAPPWQASWDEVRALFALGRTAEAEATLDAGAEAEPHSLASWLGRLRFALWRGDRAATQTLRRQLASGVVAHRELVAVSVDAATGNAPLTSALAQIESHARAAGHSQTRRAFLVQLGIELAVATNDLVRAESMLARSGGDLGVDITWTEKCPAIASLRSAPAHFRARAEVQARASVVHEVLMTPHETLSGGRA